MAKKISLAGIDAFIFDFDGVLTNNFVYINENGNESVRCSRADGLAFDVLRKLEIPAFIISTEKNQVVAKRAKKLKLPVYQGVGDKAKLLNDICTKFKFSLNRIFYTGNDVNDFKAMQLCGFTACPSDSHSKIKEISTYILEVKGGCGVVREIVENIFKVNVVDIMNN